MTGQFIDEDPNGQGGTAGTGDYYARIFWGDGGSSIATNFITTPTTGPLGPATMVSVMGSHTYTRDGAFAIIVLAYDTEGVQAPGSNLAVIVSTTAIVTDAPAGGADIIVGGNHGSSTGGSSPSSNGSGLGLGSTANSNGKAIGTGTGGAAMIDAALASIATDNAVASSAVGLATVGYDGSTPRAVKKNGSLSV